MQVANREHLRKQLQVASGGVVFTTIQKFLPEKGERMPELSQRRNIVVIADEAHRTDRRRIMVKRILNKYGYPPGLQDNSIQKVLLQAGPLCADWAVA